MSFLGTGSDFALLVRSRIIRCRETSLKMAAILRRETNGCQLSPPSSRILEHFARMRQNPPKSSEEAIQSVVTSWRIVWYAAQCRLARRRCEASRNADGRTRGTLSCMALCVGRGSDGPGVPHGCRENRPDDEGVSGPGKGRRHADEEFDSPELLTLHRGRMQGAGDRDRDGGHLPCRSPTQLPFLTGQPDHPEKGPMR